MRQDVVTDSPGTVTAGKIDDLVLFDADPLADIIKTLSWGIVR